MLYEIFEKNMLSSKLLNIAHVLKNNSLPYPAHINFFSTSTILNVFNRERLNEEGDEKDERKLKEWRQPLLPETNKNKSNELSDPDKGFFGIFKTKFPLTPWGMRDYLKHKEAENERLQQKFNKLRCQILGYDLSLAYFLVMRGGKVKFKGHSEWIELKSNNIEDILPTAFDVNYIVEEIDASDVLLFYEGLENFENVSRVKRAIFKNSPFFDDWFMDRISTIFPQLQYLDVSNCPKLSERGLEGLYRTTNLKKLIITNHRKSAAFELTCMMLEDCLPELKIEILDPVIEKYVVNKS